MLRLLPGGSSAAQMANWLAIQLDRIGAADMSLHRRDWRQRG